MTITCLASYCSPLYIVMDCTTCHMNYIFMMILNAIFNLMSLTIQCSLTWPDRFFSAWRFSILIISTFEQALIIKVDKHHAEKETFSSLLAAGHTHSLMEVDKVVPSVEV